MPIYQFDCSVCDQILEVNRPIVDGPPTLVQCPDCHGYVSKRIFHIAVLTPFQEHYNHTVGKRVNSMSQFKSELTRASEAAEEATGIPHRYVPVDWADAAAAADADVNGAGMAATHRAQVRSGQRKTKFISV